MPISFHCETCRRSICVPDGSEGKKTRCPNCYSIVRIPFSGSPKLLTTPDVPEVAPLEEEDPLGITGKTESRWDAPPPNQPSPNPFAERPEPSPVESPQAPLPGQPRDTTQKQKILKALAIALMLLGVPSLVFGLLMIGVRVVVIFEYPTDDPRTLAALAGLITVFIVQVLTLIALNEARIMRNYITARTGMILAIIPFSYPAALLIVPLALAIWGVAILYDPDVRAAFESEPKLDA